MRATETTSPSGSEFRATLDRRRLSDSALFQSSGDALIKNVTSECSNTIVVMHTVGAVIMEAWIENPNVSRSHRRRHHTKKLTSRPIAGHGCPLCRTPRPGTF